MRARQFRLRSPSDRDASAVVPILDLVFFCVFFLIKVYVTRSISVLSIIYTKSMYHFSLQIL